MIEFEPDKFIVINRKHLRIIQGEHSKRYSLGSHPLIDSLLRTIDSLNDEYSELKGRLTDNKYYVCNQDEPYAQKVLDVILEGEREKEEPNQRKVKRNCRFCGGVPYYPTNIKKNKYVTSCPNSKCPIFAVTMTVKQWEGK